MTDQPSAPVTVRAAELARALRAVAAHTSDDRALPVLGHVQIEARSGRAAGEDELRLRATNRFTCARWTLRRDVTFGDGDDWTALLHRRDAARLVSLLRPIERARSVPHDTTMVIRFEPDGRLRFATINVPDTGFDLAVPEPGDRYTFPDVAGLIDRAVPAGKAPEVLALSPAMLGLFRHATSKRGGLRLESTTEATYKPVRVTPVDGDGSFVGLIMPMRLNVEASGGR